MVACESWRRGGSVVSPELARLILRTEKRSSISPTLTRTSAPSATGVHAGVERAFWPNAHQERKRWRIALSLGHVPQLLHLAIDDALETREPFREVCAASPSNGCKAVQERFTRLSPHRTPGGVSATKSFQVPNEPLRAPDVDGAIGLEQVWNRGGPNVIDLGDGPAGSESRQRPLPCSTRCARPSPSRR